MIDSAAKIAARPADRAAPCSAAKALQPPPKGKPRCHRDVILLWGSLAECARETGIPYETVKQAARRNSIADAHRPAIVRAARRRAVAERMTRSSWRWREVTFEMLSRTAPRHGAARGAS